MTIEIKSWDVYRVIKSFICRTERIPTSFDLICLCIVSDIWSFGLSDLHKAVFLNFCQCNILFVPLQAADAKDQLHLTRPDLVTYCAVVAPGCGGAFFKMPFGFEFDLLVGGGWTSSASDDIRVQS